MTFIVGLVSHNDRSYSLGLLMFKIPTLQRTRSRNRDLSGVLLEGGAEGGVYGGRLIGEHLDNIGHRLCESRKK